MRLFQNSGLSATYRKRLAGLTSHAHTFEELTRIFLHDRYGAPHFLQPILNREPDAFFANGDDEKSQKAWARENGIAGKSPVEILLAQIEEHRTEVFYNMDPVRFSSDFVRQLPGSVRRAIAWRAAPSAREDFGAYDRVVCNFPSILRRYEEQGFNTAVFFPGHDPVLDNFFSNEHRPIDVLFVGGFSRHHTNRVQILQTVARLHGRYRVVFMLDASRLTRLAESPLGLVPPLRKRRRPSDIRAVAKPPAFGLDLYRALSDAKIVLNGAIDMAGNDRGNMRCWEALGAGAAMVSDRGNYPGGMIDGQTLALYESPDDAVRLIEELLEYPSRRQEIASSGHEMIRDRYSKAQQWSRFLEIVG
jgi:glycosyltransferase involved in cell wall biosynthesis